MDSERRLEATPFVRRIFCSQLREEKVAMVQTYRTLRVAPAGAGVLSVVLDAPPMNLIGPEPS